MSSRTYLFLCIVSYIVLTFVLTQGILNSIETVSRYGVVRGTVTDAGGRPIPDAKVEFVTDDLQSRGFGRFSDAKGNWQIDLPPGTYHFRLQKKGYRTMVVRNVKVKPKDAVYRKTKLPSF